MDLAPLKGRFKVGTLTELLTFYFQVHPSSYGLLIACWEEFPIMCPFQCTIDCRGGVETQLTYAKVGSWTQARQSQSLKPKGILGGQVQRATGASRVPTLWSVLCSLWSTLGSHLCLHLFPWFYKALHPSKGYCLCLIQKVFLMLASKRACW